MTGNFEFTADQKFNWEPSYLHPSSECFWGAGGGRLWLGRLKSTDGVIVPHGQHCTKSLKIVGDCNPLLLWSYVNMNCFLLNGAWSRQHEFNFLHNLLVQFYKSNIFSSSCSLVPPTLNFLIWRKMIKIKIF